MVGIERQESDREIPVRLVTGAGVAVSGILWVLGHQVLAAEVGAGLAWALSGSAMEDQSRPFLQKLGKAGIFISGAVMGALSLARYDHINNGKG